MQSQKLQVKTWRGWKVKLTVLLFKIIVNNELIYQKMENNKLG